MLPHQKVAARRAQKRINAEEDAGSCFASVADDNENSVDDRLEKWPVKCISTIVNKEPPSSQIGPKKEGFLISTVCFQVIWSQIGPNKGGSLLRGYPYLQLYWYTRFVTACRAVHFYLNCPRTEIELSPHEKSDVQADRGGQHSVFSFVNWLQLLITCAFIENLQLVMANSNINVCFYWKPSGNIGWLHNTDNYSCVSQQNIQHSAAPSTSPQWRVNSDLLRRRPSALWSSAITKRRVYNGWQTRIEIHIHD